MHFAFFLFTIFFFVSHYFHDFIHHVDCAVDVQQLICWNMLNLMEKNIIHSNQLNFTKEKKNKEFDLFEKTYEMH